MTCCWTAGSGPKRRKGGMDMNNAEEKITEAELEVMEVLRDAWKGAEEL